MTIILKFLYTLQYVTVIYHILLDGTVECCHSEMVAERNYSCLVLFLELCIPRCSLIFSVYQ